MKNIGSLENYQEHERISVYVCTHISRTNPKQDWKKINGIAYIPTFTNEIYSKEFVRILFLLKTIKNK